MTISSLPGSQLTFMLMQARLDVRVRLTDDHIEAFEALIKEVDPTGKALLGLGGSNSRSDIAKGSASSTTA